MVYHGVRLKTMEHMVFMDFFKNKLVAQHELQKSHDMSEKTKIQGWRKQK
jgi:hypothetical protein